MCAQWGGTGGRLPFKFQMAKRTISSSLWVCGTNTSPRPRHTHTHPRYCSQERRGCRPLHQILPATFSLCPIPLRPSHDTIALSSPSPSQSLVWPQRSPTPRSGPGMKTPPHHGSRHGLSMTGESRGCIPDNPGRQASISSGSKEPRSALESRRVSLGAHWVD